MLYKDAPIGYRWVNAEVLVEEGKFKIRLSCYLGQYTLFLFGDILHLERQPTDEGKLGQSILNHLYSLGMIEFEEETDMS